MVLSDKFGTTSEPSLVRRTLVFVLGFGLGSLALVSLLSLIMVSIAEGVLPEAKEQRGGSKAPIGAPSRAPASGASGDAEEHPGTAELPKGSGKGSSKVGGSRVNEAAEAGEPSDPPL